MRLLVVSRIARVAGPGDLFLSLVSYWSSCVHHQEIVQSLCS